MNNVTLLSLDGSILGAIDDDTTEDVVGDVSALGSAVDASAVDAVRAALSGDVATEKAVFTVVLAVAESCVGCSVVVVGMGKPFAVVASRRGS